MSDDKPPVDVAQFGKLLCYDSGKMPLGDKIGVVLVAVVGLILTVGSAIELRGPKVGQSIAGLVVGLLMLAVLWLVYLGSGRATWFYERGIVQKTRSGTRTLAYKDVVQVAYGVWFQRGQTTMNMNIGLRPRDGSPDLRFNAACEEGGKAAAGKVSEGQVHALGEMLVRMVGEEIRAGLAQGRAMPWTNDLSFEAGGLRLLKTGDLIPWNEIAWAGINENNGYVEVRVKNSKKPVVSIGNSDMNARTGMYVIQERCSQAQGTSAT